MPLRIAGAALTVLLVLAATSRGAAGAPAQTGGVPLRQVDWDTVLANDPLVQSGSTSVQGESPCIPGPVSGLGPCVSVTLAQPVLVNGLGPVTGFAGYADTLATIYADLDGDGLEEAVIPTESTGSGGSFGFLVYHQAGAGPQLVATYPGYKLSERVANGVLQVRQPFYFGFEGNCCPTGSTIHGYLLGDSGLADAAAPTFALLSQDSEVPATPAEITVAGYYRALNQRAFAVAYALLSPSARAQFVSFDDFMAGFATTTSVSAMVSAGADVHEVLVTIASTHSATDGSTVSQTFAGSWFLIDDPAAPLGVYLDAASID